MVSASGMVEIQFFLSSARQGLLATFTGRRDLGSGLERYVKDSGGEAVWTVRNGGCERDVDDGPRRHFCDLPGTVLRQTRARRAERRTNTPSSLAVVAVQAVVVDDQAR